MLGLTAALLWGVHDFAVRKISRQADPSVLLLLAFLFGAVLLVPMAGVAGGWGSLTPHVLQLALAAGVCYAFAGYGQYRAFAIGPVRLVAAITGAFPLISVSIAVVRGQDVGPLVWLGAVAVVAGIGIVARGKDDHSDGSRLAAIGWAVMACLGYAATFGLAQWAVEDAADLPVSLIVRLGAIGMVVILIALRRPVIGPALGLWRSMLVIGALDVGALTLVTMAGGLANPEYASVASSVFGIITILLAWRLLAEPVTPVQWFGVATVFGGIVLLGVA